MMLHDGWIAPLVALIESVDTVVQSVALALLSKIVKTGADTRSRTPTTFSSPPDTVVVLCAASAEAIFIHVGGMDKLVELLYSDLVNIQYLALEVIYALCARNRTLSARACALEAMHSHPK